MYNFYELQIETVQTETAIACSYLSILFPSLFHFVVVAEYVNFFSQN